MSRKGDEDDDTEESLGVRKRIKYKKGNNFKSKK